MVFQEIMSECSPPKSWITVIFVNCRTHAQKPSIWRQIIRKFVGKTCFKCRWCDQISTFRVANHLFRHVSFHSSYHHWNMPILNCILSCRVSLRCHNLPCVIFMIRKPNIILCILRNCTSYFRRRLLMIIAHIPNTANMQSFLHAMGKLFLAHFLLYC